MELKQFGVGMDITMAAAEIQWQSSQGVVIGIEARPHTIGG
jgi:hypothetical protein